MKSKNILFILLGLLLSTITSAQQADITHFLVKKANNNVMISFVIEVDKVPTNSILTITPTIWNGNKKRSLYPVVVMGRNKAIMNSRKGVEKPGYVMDNSSEPILYETTIPFETWMAGSSVSVGKVFEKCSALQDRLPSMIIACNILQPAPLPKSVIVTPIIPVFGSDAKAAYINGFQQTLDDSIPIYFVGSKEYVDNNSSGITFRQGSSVIDESYMNNQDYTRRIQETFKLIKADSNVYVTNLIIIGGSSPEGGYVINENISQDRAKSLRDYFTPKIVSDICEVKNIGENWDGLYSMVKNSNMDYRDEVLSIINNYSIFEGRQRELMDLAGGSPYRYMYKEFFPELRKATYIQIFYDIHPNDEFLKIDKASKLIKSKDYKQALKLLEEVTSTPYTNNLVGVCYMMMGDSANAKIYLQKAINGGNRDAQKNLNIMND